MRSERVPKILNMLFKIKKQQQRKICCCFFMNFFIRLKQSRGMKLFKTCKKALENSSLIHNDFLRNVLGSFRVHEVRKRSFIEKLILTSIDDV